MCKALMNANLRVNEFKLRQQEISRTPIPNELNPKVRELMKQGFSKKAIKLVLGCSYDDLKTINLSH
ncbi:hypothetical protein [Vibrio alginolyticus]|uniref:hypothetical protein n=1 Tax=Vibrio alginolyticus TaxID=663 RepID=UPI00296576BC|nr:hypothetical protein [Vibrio sp. 945]